MKKLLVTIVKFGISGGILVYLLVQAQRHQSFAELRSQPKDWSLLALAWALAFTGVSLSFVRWYMLVRALGMRFRMQDAFRLGFLGYLFNFVSVGSVGGDLFKAVFLAREQPGRRTEAVATVLVDRIVGMYSLFLLASAGILLTGTLGDTRSVPLQTIARATLLATGVGTLAVMVLLVPAATGPKMLRMVGAIPKVGKVLSSLVSAARVYRDKLPVLVAGCVLSVTSHVLYAVSVYLIACGLPGAHPPLAAHFVIVPVGSAASGLPLPLGALGAMEYVLDYLYRKVAASNQGLVVALGFRLTSVLTAMVGAGIYLASRREVEELMHETELEQHRADAAEEAEAEAG